MAFAWSIIIPFLGWALYYNAGTIKEVIREMCEKIKWF